MSKSLAVFAMTLGIVAFSAGSAFASGGCGSYGTQSVAVDTQTASTGSSGGEAPSTPIPETSN